LKGEAMDMVVGLVGVILMVYLFVSVLRPEWF
jgi:K+-transporting ATPase KdpF subunit